MDDFQQDATSEYKCAAAAPFACEPFIQHLLHGFVRAFNNELVKARQCEGWFAGRIVAGVECVRLLVGGRLHVVEELGDFSLLDLEPLAQGVDGLRVGRGQRAERIERGEELFRFALVDIEYQNGNFHLRGRFRTEVAVDQLQASIRELAGEQGIGKADFAQQRREHRPLLRPVRSPVERVGREIGRADATQFLDPIAQWLVQSRRTSDALGGCVDAAAR